MKRLMDTLVYLACLMSSLPVTAIRRAFSMQLQRVE